MHKDYHGVLKFKKTPVNKPYKKAIRCKMSSIFRKLIYARDYIGNKV